MTNYGEYREYIVDFMVNQFYLIDTNGKRISVIPFDTDLGFQMLIGFALYLLNPEMQESY